MKIGIMTFWWSEDNYGQLLQCYALQKYLRDQGHDAYLIRYYPYKKKSLLKRLIKALNPINTFKYIIKKVNTPKKRIQVDRGFNEFRLKNIKQTEKIYSNIEDLKECNNFFDIFIAGSDQIWNFESKDQVCSSPYTLNFVNDNKLKISYAASFGRSEISNKIASKVESVLRRFNFISLRELSGKKICDNLGIKSEVVCDPTLLLSKKEYEKLFKNDNHIEHKYVFLYLLTNPCDVSIKKLSFWAKKNDLDIIYVTGNLGWKKLKYDDDCIQQSFLTIGEWLFYLNNAEYILTNSFHCCLFALLFEKKVITIPLIGELSNTNTRISNLYSMLGIEQIDLTNNNFDILKTIKPTTIQDSLIKSSKLLLNKVLNNNLQE